MQLHYHLFLQWYSPAFDWRFRYLHYWTLRQAALQQVAPEQAALQQVAPEQAALQQAALQQAALQQVAPEQALLRQADH